MAASKPNVVPRNRASWRWKKWRRWKNLSAPSMIEHSGRWGGSSLGSPNVIQATGRITGKSKKGKRRDWSCFYIFDFCPPPQKKWKHNWTYFTGKVAQGYILPDSCVLVNLEQHSNSFSFARTKHGPHLFSFLRMGSFDCACQMWATPSHKTSDTGQSVNNKKRTILADVWF